MIERFLTESEIKQTEYMIINHNICRTINNINDELRANQNNNELLNYNKNYDKNYKKKEYNKDKSNPNNYK